MINKSTISKIIILHKDDSFISAIAIECSVSSNTVRKYLSLHNYKLRKYNIINSHVNDDALIGLYLGLWAGDGTQYYDRGYTIKICCDSRNHKLISLISNLVYKLFQKRTFVHNFVHNEERNRTQIKFYSKYIYYFVKNYMIYRRDKAFTVRLKNKIDSYSIHFLHSFLLGIMLSDGYLREKFLFNTISKELAKNVSNILIKYGLSPSTYMHDRTKYGWRNLYMVRVNKKDTMKAENTLNNALKILGSSDSFSEIKGYGPAEI